MDKLSTNNSRLKLQHSSTTKIKTIGGVILNRDDKYIIS